MFLFLSLSAVATALADGALPPPTCPPSPRAATRSSTVPSSPTSRSTESTDSFVSPSVTSCTRSNSPPFGSPIPRHSTAFRKAFNARRASRLSYPASAYSDFPSATYPETTRRLNTSDDASLPSVFASNNCSAPTASTRACSYPFALQHTLDRQINASGTDKHSRRDVSLPPSPSSSREVCARLPQCR